MVGEELELETTQEVELGDGTAEISFLDEDGLATAVEDLLAIRQKEAPIDHDNAIVLRLVDEAVSTESEEALQFDPEAVKEMVVKMLGGELQEIKRLFTNVTGKVIR